MNLHAKDMPSLKNIVTVRSYSDLAGLPGQNPEAVIMMSNLDISSCPGEISKDAYRFQDGINPSILGHLHYPMTARLASEEIKALYQIVSNGTVLLLSCDAAKQEQLRFFELLLARFWLLEEHYKNPQLIETDDGSSIFRQQVRNKHKTGVPFVVGRTSLPGKKFQCAPGSRMAPVWSCQWCLSTDKFRRTLSDRICGLRRKNTEASQSGGTEFNLPDEESVCTQILIGIRNKYREYSGFDLDAPQDHFRKFIRYSGGKALKLLRDSLRDIDVLSEWVTDDKDSFTLGNNWNRNIFIKLNTIFQIPDNSVFDAAGKSMSAECLLLDTTSTGLPLCVARKFGKGCVVVCPDGLDASLILNEVVRSVLQPDASQGGAIVPAEIGGPKTGITEPVSVAANSNGCGAEQEYTLSPTFTGLATITDWDNSLKINASLDSKPYTPPLSSFIKFLVIWLYCKEGNSIVYCGTGRSFSGVKLLDNQNNLQEVPELHVLEIPADPRDPAQIIRRIIDWTLFGKQDAYSDEEKTLRKNLYVCDKVVPNNGKAKTYKRVTIRNLRIVMDGENMASLKALKLPDYIRTHINDSFFQRLEMVISKPG